MIFIKRKYILHNLLILLFYSFCFWRICRCTPSLSNPTSGSIQGYTVTQQKTKPSLAIIHISIFSQVLWLHYACNYTSQCNSSPVCTTNKHICKSFHLSWDSKDWGQWIRYDTFTWRRLDFTRFLKYSNDFWLSSIISFVAFTFYMLELDLDLEHMKTQAIIIIYL